MERKFQAKIVNNNIQFSEKVDFRKFEGKNVDIVISFDKSRTLSQNNYYWGVIVPLIAEEMGDDTESVHEILKHKFLKKTKTIKNRKGNEEQIEKVISTTKLTTKQFIQYIDSVKRWASSFLGLYIPDPGEVTIGNGLIIN